MVNDFVTNTWRSIPERLSSQKAESIRTWATPTFAASAVAIAC
jgi:hypothetical protein